MDKLPVREVPFKAWGDYFKDSFDPTKDDLPEGMDGICHVQFARIKPLISRFSFKELNYAMCCIHELSRRMDDFYFDTVRARMRAEGKTRSEPFLEFQAFKEYRHVIDLDETFKNMPASKKVKWAEFYALYSLYWLKQLVRLYRQKDLPDLPKNADKKSKYLRKIDQGSYDAYLLTYLVTVTDALSAAEIYSEWQQQAKKGGKKSTKRYKTAPVKEKALTIWAEKYQSVPNRRAARWILNALSDDEKKLFSTDDPIQTIAIWIGNHKKALNRSQAE